MDALIWLKRTLNPIVGRLGVRRLARVVYRQLLRWRYGRDGLASVRQNDRTWKLHYEVALRGEYQEFDTVLWLRRKVKPGDCVFDIGANVGQMTLEAAELVGPDGRVIAIEPAPGNAKLLRLHVDANGFAARVTILEAGCGEADGGTRALYVHGDTAAAVGSGHNLRGPSHGGTWTTVAVPIVSVDAVCKRLQVRPAVLKIDVEGAEKHVLAGCRATLALCRPSVLFGFHPFAYTDATTASVEIRKLLDSVDYDSPELPTPTGYELSEYEAVAR